MAIIDYTQDNITYYLDTSNYAATVTGRDVTTLTTINLPETIEYEGDTFTVRHILFDAFSGTNITSLSMPDTITSIGYNAFYMCTELTGQLVLPASLITLNQFAFQGCTGLTGNIVIPSTITTFGAGVFQDCTALSGVTFEEGLTKIADQLFWRCTGLTGNIVIPDSVLEIGTSAFNGCTGLTGSLTIGENVQLIGNYAFDGCSFSGTIVVPPSVTTLNIGAFSSGHVEQGSFKDLVEVDLDLDDITGLPDSGPLEERLEQEYEDTVTSSTSESFIFKSANIDEIEINYAQALDKGFDFLFVLDISDSMQNTALSVLQAVEHRYPRMVYATQIIDKLSAELLDTDYDNRVAITTFSSTSTPAVWNTGGFVTNYASLQTLIWDNYPWHGNTTNYSAGLISAIQLINARTDTSRDVVIIFVSDGKPNEGNKDAQGVYGGTEAQTLRNMNVPLYPISIFLSDTELADARAALTAISYDKNTYYEARDVDSFQTIITEVIGDAMTEMSDTTIRESLSQYFEPLTGTSADLIADCGSAEFDSNGDVIWDLSGCSSATIHSLRIKTKVVDANIPQTDYYPTNEELEILDPCQTILEESPQIYITRALSSAKGVIDADGDGKASPGEILTYTITATNSGDVSFADLFVQDTLQNVLPYMEDATAVPVILDIAGVVSTKTISELMTGFSINLGAGEVATITLSLTVSPSLDTSVVTVLTNQATVGSTAAQAEIETKGLSAYSVIKTVQNADGDDIDHGTIREGETITYTIRATALSVAEPIGPIVFLDEISDFIYHIGDEDTVTTMSGETFLVHPTYSGSLMSVETERYLTSVGDWVEVKFYAHVMEGTGGNVVINQSTVTAGELEQETNITQVNIFALEGDPVKSVSQTSSSGKNGSFVKVGDEITYEITYTNYESVPATVLISDKLPLGVDFVSATDGGLFNDATRTVAWSIDNVPADTQGTVFLVVRVNKSAAWSVGNYAVVQVGGNAPRFSNYVENPIQGAGCRRLKHSTHCRKTIKGQKIWKDGDNIANTRPPAVEIVLLRDGVLYKSATISSLGDGKYEFGCLPDWKNSAHKYVYQVDEPEVADGYTKAIQGNNIVNTAEPIFITIQGTKVWNDDNNSLGIRPAQITVELLQNGAVYASTTVASPPDEEDTSTFSFPDVPLFNNDRVAFAYTLNELIVPEYLSEIDGFNITNTQQIYGLSIDYLNNGGTGNFSDDRTPFASNYRVRTLAETGISHSGTGIWFDSWNTSPDGLGERYIANQVIEVTDNLTLYAQWYQVFNVSYSRNTESPYVIVITARSDKPYTILSAEELNFFREDFVFAGWNTKANGKGTAYEPGDVVSLTANLQLFAQWKYIIV